MTEYKNSADYKEAIEIIREFRNTVLGGDIRGLIDADMDELIRRLPDIVDRKKFYGTVDDPDMYKITQAIYIVVWGEIYDLTFEKLGPWSLKSGKLCPFRGDTMNSFNTLFGKEARVAERYEVSDELWDKIHKFQNTYHSVGNFIVIPNRENVNMLRAEYCTIQDYFDTFVGVVFQYQHPLLPTPYGEFCHELKPALDANPEYKSLQFPEWVSKFWLQEYTEKGKPRETFGISYETRKKERRWGKRRSKTDFYDDAEYCEIVEKYIDKASEIIHARAEKICETLGKAI